MYLLYERQTHMLVDINTEKCLLLCIGDIVTYVSRLLAVFIWIKIALLPAYNDFYWQKNFMLTRCLVPDTPVCGLPTCIVHWNVSIVLFPPTDKNVLPWINILIMG